uniref:Zinc transporter ZIP1 n=1 Tax=Romanomermis culicivorax TaxID=13658 RepID=A0A915L7C9_ROMCU
MRYKLTNYVTIDHTALISTTNSTDIVIIIRRHVQAVKSILLVFLLAVTLTTSLLPFLLRRAALHSRSVQRRSIFACLFSHLSCFGGGVFLATCLLDLLPDTREVLQKAFLLDDDDEHSFPISSTANKPQYADFPLAEFLTACGFFLVLFSEQIFVYFREESLFLHERHSHSEENYADGHVAEHRHVSVKRKRTAEVGYLGSVPSGDAPPAQTTSSVHNPSPELEISNDHADEVSIIDYTAEIAQDIHFDPESHSTSRTLLLLAALCLHSTFEGLALGLQRESGVALQIFTALCIHKSIIGFSLGLQLVQSKLSNKIVAYCCLLFSLTTPLGGILGLIVTEGMSENANASPNTDLINGCLQGLACGTFLYITSFEILPHELNDSRGRNRLTKLIMLVFGFAVICFFVLLWPQ